MVPFPMDPWSDKAPAVLRVVVRVSHPPPPPPPGPPSWLLRKTATVVHALNTHPTHKHTQNTAQHRTPTAQHTNNTVQHTHNTAQHRTHTAQHTNNTAQHTNNIAQHTNNIAQHRTHTAEQSTVQHSKAQHTAHKEHTQSTYRAHFTCHSTHHTTNPGPRRGGGCVCVCVPLC